LHICHD